MDPRRQVRMSGHAVQHGDELTALDLIERREHRGLQLVRHGVGVAQDLTRTVGELDGVSAPVDRVPGAPHEALSLQLVDEADHGVAVHPEQVGQLLLTETVGIAQVGQDAEVRRMETQRSQLVRQLVGDMMAELGEQEHAAVG